MFDYPLCCKPAAVLSRSLWSERSDHIKVTLCFKFFKSTNRHMMGKRVDYACRSVISPDPYIGTNEIGIPEVFAKKLTCASPVTALNVEEMRKLVKRGPDNYPGAVWVEEADGRRLDIHRMSADSREAVAARLLTGKGQMKVGRQLRDGDMMLMNRQVSSRQNVCNSAFELPDDEYNSHAPL